MSLLATAAPSNVAVVGFVTLVTVVTVAIVGLVPIASQRAGDNQRVAARRTATVAISLAGWLALTWLVAASGILEQFDRRPPPLLLLVGSSLILSTVVAFSRFGLLLARSLPTAMLVGIHVFRLPLELILYQLSFDGVLPVQMTFDGMNYDILTGILAAAVALWASWYEPPRAVLLMWNLLGLFLLLVIMTIAMLSAPLPIRLFPNDPANAIVATAPFVWLPTVLVQVAWIGHLLVFRRLRRR
ncbi:MAG TPA: hypothetical protein VN634_12280 [Candidatus Limnocylindrales bacterium]|nr:hypothetical protein [Candidatus Limnocylindrales bacterium]